MWCLQHKEAECRVITSHSAVWRGVCGYFVVHDLMKWMVARNASFLQV